jgi:hypothetical protein
LGANPSSPRSNWETAALVAGKKEAQSSAPHSTKESTCMDPYPSARIPDEFNDDGYFVVGFMVVYINSGARMSKGEQHDEDGWA